MTNLASVLKAAARQLRKGDEGLYVCRQLERTCHQELTQWMAAQGLPPLDANPHVTIVHSKTNVPGWTCLEGPLLVPREALLHWQTLGAEGAVVLRFRSPALHARWQRSKKLGATWDYPAYNPHMTAYYKGPVPTTRPDFDLVFGPELCAPLDSDVFDVHKFDALAWYADTGKARGLNAALRGEVPLSPTEAQARASLDQLFTTTLTTRPVLLYRGVSAEDEFGEALCTATPGQQFSAHGYTSTSKSRDTATSWGPVLLSGLLPPGAQLLTISPTEELLPRGTTFTVQARSGTRLLVDWHAPVAP